MNVVKVEISLIDTRCRNIVGISWKYCWKYRRNIVEILLKYCRNIEETLWKYCWMIVEVLWKHCGNDRHQGGNLTH